MYVDTSKSIQNGKVYTRSLLRESYREKGKVKHRTIANISKCSDKEIQAIKLALKHKNDLTSLGSLKGNIKTLHITRALGNSTDAKLALWQVMARIIDQGSRLSAVRFAGTHAACDLLNLDSFNEDNLYETAGKDREAVIQVTV